MGKTNLENYDWLKILLELVGIRQIMQEHWWIYVGLGIRGCIQYWLKITDSKCRVKIQDQNAESKHRIKSDSKSKLISQD